MVPVHSAESPGTLKHERRRNIGMAGLSGVSGFGLNDFRGKNQGAD
jgi:hypothetical protein